MHESYAGGPSGTLNLFLILILYLDWELGKTFSYVLQGQREVSTDSIKLALMAFDTQFVFMDEVGRNQPLFVKVLTLDTN